MRITVADDGVGMPAEVVEHAFEPFFTTKEAGEGTGLGLATVHGVVIDAGGTVEIDSEVGRGTTVTVFLPESDDRGDASPRSRPRPATGRRRYERPRRRGPGPGAPPGLPDPRGARLRVREAASGDEALAAWEPVDVLVTDVVMPGMSGQQLAEQARERIPACASSSCPATPTTSSCATAPASGDIAFVQKPFTRDSLLRAVEEALVPERRR